MERILCFTALLKRVFATKGWWYIAPFALIGLVFSGLFYILSPFYMIFDYVRLEIKKILYNDNEGLSGAAQFVKFMIGFFAYMLSAVLVIIVSIPLAMAYFLVFIAFFVSSIGRFRGNPFGFHFLKE